MTESELEFYFLDDLFPALGYPRAPDAVLVETPVQVGSGTTRADYVLWDMSGRPKVIGSKLSRTKALNPLMSTFNLAH
jgi:hypothetical protein